MKVWIFLGFGIEGVGFRDFANRFQDVGLRVDGIQFSRVWVLWCKV